MGTAVEKLCGYELAHDLRQLVKDGHTVPALVATIRQRLDIEDNNLLRCLPCFCYAFGMRLGDAKVLGAWSGFPNGTWSDEQINAEIMPIILRNKESWEKESWEKKKPENI